MSGYSPFRIAAFFLQKATQQYAGITPMQLIKWVYIAHAWSLAFFKRSLISESIQAWKYGPVIQSLYHYFKVYGNSSIPASELNKLPQDELDQQTTGLLEKVWEKYGRLSGTHLSSLTHLPGTPWDQVWTMHGGRYKYIPIPDKLIQEFYERKLESNTGSGH